MIDSRHARRTDTYHPDIPVILSAAKDLPTKVVILNGVKDLKTTNVILNTVKDLQTQANEDIYIKQ